MLFTLISSLLSYSRPSHTTSIRLETLRKSRGISDFRAMLGDRSERDKHDRTASRVRMTSLIALTLVRAFVPIVRTTCGIRILLGEQLCK
jgi:hypothetical protein